jgi:hypothetical protein
MSLFFSPLSVEIWKAAYQNTSLSRPWFAKIHITCIHKNGYYSRFRHFPSFSCPIWFGWDRSLAPMPWWLLPVHGYITYLPRYTLYMFHRDGPPLRDRWHLLLALQQSGKISADPLSFSISTLTKRWVKILMILEQWSVFFFLVGGACDSVEWSKRRGCNSKDAYRVVVDKSPNVTEIVLCKIPQADDVGTWTP